MMRCDTLYLSINKAIEYIEDNLRNPINLDSISDHVNISKFYLNRIFSSLSKSSLMNYVKIRKLSSSVNELLRTNLRISDISQEYGFNYEQSYIRSFTNCFGLSPDKFRRERPSLKIKDKINVDYIKEIGADGIALEPPIFITPEFYIIGMRHRIYRADDELLEVANRLGIDFYDNHKCKIKSVINPNVYIGFVEYVSEEQIYTHYTPSVQVSSPGEVPEGMVSNRIPTQKYASFKYIGLHRARNISINNLNSTLNYIFREWFPRSGYRQAAPYHFEKIDEKASRDDYCELEFFVPVVGK